MLEKLLGTSGKISLLRVMLTGGKKSFSLNELARESGLSPSTAFKEVKDLVGALVDHEQPSKRYRARETALSAELRRIFELEKKLYRTAGAAIFDMLAGLGSYYVTGASAVVLRGLGRDFVASGDFLMVICDRKVSKLRGALISLFPSYRLLLLEGEVRPADFTGEEVLFKGETAKVNLARLEKAAVDALWRPGWEGVNVPSAVCCLLERRLDAGLLKKHARERGPKVEARLREAMKAVNRAAGTRYAPGGLGTAGVPRRFRTEVEGAVERVLKGGG